MESLKTRTHTLFVYGSVENQTIVAQNFGIDDFAAYDALDEAQQSFTDEAQSRYGVFLLGQIEPQPLGSSFFALHAGLHKGLTHPQQHEIDNKVDHEPVRNQQPRVEWPQHFTVRVNDTHYAANVDFATDGFGNG